MHPLQFAEMTLAQLLDRWKIPPACDSNPQLRKHHVQSVQRLEIGTMSVEKVEMHETLPAQAPADAFGN